VDPDTRTARARSEPLGEGGERAEAQALDAIVASPGVRASGVGALTP